jgi:hypothetical protein
VRYAIGLLNAVASPAGRSPAFIGVALGNSNYYFCEDAVSDNKALQIENAELRQRIKDLEALYANPHPEIKILELCESGCDGGDFMGYYCREHVDKEAFAKAANFHGGHLCGYGYDDRYVEARHVVHLWFRTVPIAGQDGEMQFIPAAGPARGAWAATVGEMQMRRHQRELRRRVSDYDRGRLRGIEEAIGWAHGVLLWSGGTADDIERMREAGAFLLQCWTGHGRQDLERQRHRDGE